jgi:hypothetical protein
MTAVQIASLVAAVAVAAWTFRDQLKRLSLPIISRGPSYQQAMVSLASVRLRLIETSTLSREASDAIEALTLVLVAGSDK